MLNVTLTCSELLDQFPVPGVALTVHADVVGRWRERINDEEWDRRFAFVSPTQRKPGIEIPVPDIARGVRVTVVTESGADGTANIQFNLDQAFAQAAALRKDGKPPVDTGALLSISAAVAGVEFTATYASDSLEESSSSLLPANGVHSIVVPVDFAKSFVGHVTENTARLLFRLHGINQPGDYICEVHQWAPPPLLVPIFPFDPIRKFGDTLLPADALNSGPGVETGTGIQANSNTKNTHANELITTAAADLEKFLRHDVTAPLIEKGNWRLHRSVSVSPDIDTANTATILVDGLKPGRSYAYRLYLRDNDERDVIGAGQPLTGGGFKADDPNARELNFSFGSCHHPVSNQNDFRAKVFASWDRIAQQDNNELLLLLGDQIYGDGIELVEDKDLSWRDLYLQRYDHFYMYPEVRNVLRRTPTCMVLDDHDVVDDFGVVPVQELVEPPSHRFGEDRVREAMQAYTAFQQAHGPLGATPDGDVRHYSFRRGPASFFMLDNRTHRIPNPDGKLSPAEPILGLRQKNDLRSWANDLLDSDVDVVFLAAPVPVAFLPVEEIRRLIKDVKKAGAQLGAALGTLISPFGFGAAIGAKFGYSKAVTKLNEAGLGDFTSRDLADMWTFAPNQKDMVFLLDLLFDVANDIRADGSQGNRPRAVFLLGGDVHIGVLHAIRSMHARHQRNPVIFQAVSSPLTNKPPQDKTFQTIVSKIRNDLDVTALELLAPRSPTTQDILDAAFGDVGNAAFVLDDTQGAHYAAEFIGMITERNHGAVAIKHTGGAQREYRCELTIQGNSAINSTFVLNLDASRVQAVRFAAQVIEFSVPRTAKRGSQIPVRIVMRNNGVEPWTDEHQLVMFQTLGLGTSIAVSGAPILPGDQAVFQFNIPAFALGEQRYRWRLARGRTVFFGEFTPFAIVNVTSALTGSAACQELADDIVKATRELKALQASLNSAPGPQKAQWRALIREKDKEITELKRQKRIRGCP